MKIIEIVDLGLMDSLVVTDKSEKVVTIKSTKLIKKLNKQLRLCGVLKPLKDKEVISFKEWKLRRLVGINTTDNTYLHDTEGWIEEDKLIDKYNSEVMNI